MSQLTRQRMIGAMGVAVAADVLQLALGPLGWTFLDEIIDVAAMLITVRLIGFHWLLLPTFIVEVVPFLDMLPTWTACVAWVIRLRNKEALPAGRAPEVRSPMPPGSSAAGPDS